MALYKYVYDCDYDYEMTQVMLGMDRRSDALECAA